MDKVNLLPCPFCGEAIGAKDIYRNEVGDRGSLGYYIVHHCFGGVEISTGTYETEYEVAAAWNRRADGWIDCKVKLPEFGLIVLGYGPKLSGLRLVNRYNYLDNDWSWEGSDTAFYYHDTFTYWQPLPEPPGGGGNETAPTRRG